MSTISFDLATKEFYFLRVNDHGVVHEFPVPFTSPKAAKNHFYNVLKKSHYGYELDGDGITKRVTNAEEWNAYNNGCQNHINTFISLMMAMSQFLNHLHLHYPYYYNEDKHELNKFKSYLNNTLKKVKLRKKDDESNDRFQERLESLPDVLDDYSGFIADLLSYVMLLPDDHEEYIVKFFGSYIMETYKTDHKPSLFMASDLDAVLKEMNTDLKFAKEIKERIIKRVES